MQGKPSRGTESLTVTLRKRYAAGLTARALSCGVPFRADIASPPPDALDRLVELGALDIETIGAGIAALLPDAVTQDALAQALASATVTVSPAVGRDNDSVWLLSQRPVRIGRLVIGDAAAPPEALRLTDSHAFGTGHHPTTALCIEALEEILAIESIDRILDIGTGSGVLALAALKLGVQHAVGLDLDAEALTVAAENARLNGLADRLQVMHSGPEAVDGRWPLVAANILAAPLIELAPILVRRVDRGGLIILSGIQTSVEFEVRQAYQHLGMRNFRSAARAGWVALTGQASW